MLLLEVKSTYKNNLNLANLSYLDGITVFIQELTHMEILKSGTIEVARLKTLDGDF